MSDKTFSEINDEWLALCEEARDARHKRDILLFSVSHPEILNSEAMNTYENAEIILNEIEDRISKFRKNYRF